MDGRIYYNDGSVFCDFHATRCKNEYEVGPTCTSLMPIIPNECIIQISVRERCPGISSFNGEYIFHCITPVLPCISWDGSPKCVSKSVKLCDEWETLPPSIKQVVMDDSVVITLQLVKVPPSLLEIDDNTGERCVYGLRLMTVSPPVPKWID